MSNMKTSSSGLPLPVSILKESSYERIDTPNTSASSLDSPHSMSKTSDRTQEDLSTSTLEESQVPESNLQQPALDTIDPSKATGRSTKSSDFQRRSRKVRVAPNDRSQSPRSINMQTDDLEAAPAPPIPGAVPFAPQQPHQRQRPKKHRRSNSDTVPRDVRGYVYQQPQAPPYYGYYPPAPGYYSPQVGAPMPMAMGALPPPPPPPTTLTYSTRTRSWSGDQGDQVRPLIPPVTAPPQAPLGRPSSFQEGQYSETRPLLSHQPQSERNLSKSRRRHRHRKSRSHSEGIPNAAAYGAFWHGEAPPSPSSQGPFSARNEIMTLTSSFRNPGEMSPHRTSPVTNYRKSAVTWSPSTPPPTYDGNYQAGGNTSPFVGAMPDLGSSSGGEAVFMAQRRGGRTESTRKKHMRQKSAQLFMEDAKGIEQPPACRDVFFLLLFVFHLLGVVYLSSAYGYEALRLHDPVEEEDSSVTIYYKNLLYIACISGGFAVALSATLLGVMTLFARRFVQVALMVVITLSFVWGTIGIGLSPKTVVPVTGIIALALSVAYAFIVWDRIPFAAANLLTALSGIRAFPGTILVAFFVQGLSLACTIYYAIVFIGIYDAVKEGRILVSDRVAVVIYILLGISFYWTFQVLLNVVQVVTAGIIGKWWYKQEGDGLVRRSSFKTVFYSMGSICFGSLFVGPVNVIRQVAVLFRPTATEEASLMCVHECLLCIQTCITSCVDTLSDSFNWWAFTFIGLYGYGFLEAGHRATELFHKRGWTAIVSDDLVPNVLVMTSLVIGGVTGCVAHLLSAADRLHVLSIDEPGLVSFGTGVLIGLVLTRVLFGAVGSAVNAVLVLFASSPVDFEQNHPELSQEMRAAWREVWPGALDIVDLRVALNMPGPLEPV